jgi:hypothetical protein
MRVAIILLAVSLTCARAEADEVHDKVAALPLLGTIKHGRTVVEVRGDVSAKQKAEVVRVADFVIADVQRRFTQKKTTPDPTISLVLMPSLDRYRTFCEVFDDTPSDLGFYRPDFRVAIANLGNSIGNLRHELVHPLIDDDFPDMPSWLGEGIGSLYGTAKCSATGCEFLVNYRLRDLQKAIKDGTLPSVAELADSNSAEVHGSRGMMYYAMSRYVLLFVDQHGKLSQLYAELRAAKDATAQRDILASYVDDKAFVAWAKRLRL